MCGPPPFITESVERIDFEILGCDARVYCIQVLLYIYFFLVSGRCQSRSDSLIERGLFAACQLVGSQMSQTRHARATRRLSLVRTVKKEADFQFGEKEDATQTRLEFALGSRSVFLELVSRLCKVKVFRGGAASLTRRSRSVGKSSSSAKKKCVSSSASDQSHGSSGNIVGD